MWIIPDVYNAFEGAVLADTFVDTNGTLIPPHAPQIGGPWTGAGGTPTIESNAFTGPAGDNEIQASVTGNGFSWTFNPVFPGGNNAEYVQTYLTPTSGSGQINVQCFQTGKVELTYIDSTNLVVFSGSFKLAAAPTQIAVTVTPGIARITVRADGATVLTAAGSSSPFTPTTFLANAHVVTMANTAGMQNLIVTSP